MAKKEYGVAAKFLFAKEIIKVKFHLLNEKMDVRITDESKDNLAYLVWRKPITRELTTKKPPMICHIEG